MPRRRRWRDSDWVTRRRLRRATYAGSPVDVQRHVEAVLRVAQRAKQRPWTKGV